MKNDESSPPAAARRQPACPDQAARPDQADYEALAEFRYRIRCFLEFSQNRARAVGLTPRQHQALLAIRGLAGGRKANIGDLAERLRIRHHSAAELVDRLAEADLVLRSHDPGDQRRVLLNLTARAEECLAGLSAAHLKEVERMAPMLEQMLALLKRRG